MPLLSDEMSLDHLKARIAELIWYLSDEDILNLLLNMEKDPGESYASSDIRKAQVLMLKRNLDILNIEMYDARSEVEQGHPKLEPTLVKRTYLSGHITDCTQ